MHDSTRDEWAGAGLSRLGCNYQSHLACQRNLARSRAHDAGKTSIFGKRKRGDSGKNYKFRSVLCFKSEARIRSVRSDSASADLKASRISRRQGAYLSVSASTVFRTHSWHFRHFMVTLTHAIEVPSMLLSSASFCSSSTAFTNSVL